MLSSTFQFSARGKRLSVVVADDVTEIRNLVLHWLGEVGCDVMCVSTGNEVLKLLRTHTFDLVITDVIMPDGDGLEVIASVRRVQPSARVLAFSGGGHHLRAIECLKFAKGLGAHAVLMKPFNRDQLLEAVNQAVLVEGPESAQRPAGSSDGI